MQPRPVSRLEALVSWLAFPAYVWQGLGVRRRSTRLAPPTHNGWLESRGAYKGEALKVLIVGDSSAAGVGALTIGESLGGQLPDLLAEKLNRPVSVRIAGNNSATAGQIRDYVVPHLANGAYDYICLNIGTNDAVDWGLNVSARITHDNRVYPPSNCARLKIRFDYRFDRSIGSDVLAYREVILYGDGRWETSGDWLQASMLSANGQSRQPAYA